MLFVTLFVVTNATLQNKNFQYASVAEKDNSLHNKVSRSLQRLIQAGKGTKCCSSTRISIHEQASGEYKVSFSFIPSTKVALTKISRLWK